MSHNGPESSPCWLPNTMSIRFLWLNFHNFEYVFAIKCMYKEIQKATYKLIKW